MQKLRSRTKRAGSIDGPRTDVMISIDDAHLNAVSNVVKDLSRAGLKVADVVESIGTITGSIATAKVRALADVPGVGHVEQQRVFELPPRGALVQ